MLLPAASFSSVSASSGAAASIAGKSTNCPSRSWAASSDSISRRKVSSCSQAVCKYAARSSVGRSSAALKMPLIFRQRSSFIPGILLPELAREPGSGHIPITRHRIGRDIQYLCDLVRVQSAVKAQLDDLSASRVNRGEAFERLVQSDKLVGTRLRNYRYFI